MNDSPWLTAADAATYLKRGRRFVLREIHAGRLRAARIGGRGEVLLRREWCDQWVSVRSKPVADAAERIRVLEGELQRQRELTEQEKRRGDALALQVKAAFRVAWPAPRLKHEI